MASERKTRRTRSVIRVRFGAVVAFKGQLTGDCVVNLVIVVRGPYGVAKGAINVSDLRHEKQILDPF